MAKRNEEDRVGSIILSTLSEKLEETHDYSKNQ